MKDKKTVKTSSISRYERSHAIFVWCYVLRDIVEGHETADVCAAIFCIAV